MRIISGVREVCKCQQLGQKKKKKKKKPERDKEILSGKKKRDGLYVLSAGKKIPLF